MIFHENCLLADDFQWNIIPYFCRKLGKLWQNLLSAAVVIDALRVNSLHAIKFFMHLPSSSDFFSKMNLFKNSFKNTIGVSNVLDPDQDLCGDLLNPLHHNNPTSLKYNVFENIPEYFQKY